MEKQRSYTVNTYRCCIKVGHTPNTWVTRSYQLNNRRQFVELWIMEATVHGLVCVVKVALKECSGVLHDLVDPLDSCL